MDIIRGRLFPKPGSKLKTNDEKRVCTKEGCGTKLSRYNRAKNGLCWSHKPRRIPRVRGRQYKKK